MFPNFLIERKIYSFASVLVETLEISAINIDSISISASQTEKRFYFARDVLTFNYLSCFPLSIIPQIIIDIWTQKIIIAVEKWVLLFDLCVLAGFECFVGEEKDGRVSDRQTIFNFDGG